MSRTRWLDWNPPEEVAPERWPTGMRGLLGVIRPYRWLLAATIGSALVNHGSAIAAAVLAAAMVGAAIEGATAAELQPLVFLLIVAVVLRSLGAFLESWLGHDLAFRLLAIVRQWIYWGVERIAPGGLVRKRGGDLTAAAMQDAEKLEVFFAHIVVEAVVVVVVPLVTLTALAWIQPGAALLLIPVLLLMATVPLWLLRLADRQGRIVRDAAGEMQADVLEAAQGLREVIVFGRQDAWLDRLDRMGHQLARSQLRLGARAGAEVAVSNTLAAVGVLAVLIITYQGVRDGTVSARAAPVAVTLAAVTLLSLVRFITVLAQNRGEVFGSADRIFGLINEEPMVADRGSAHVDARPAISFEAVGFRYLPDGPPALEEVTFRADAGATIALVGPSGAGKSTCASLLMRFWDPDEGVIRLGAHDLRDLGIEHLRSAIGFVPQDPFLFHASIADNIRLRDPGSSDEEVRRAARLARADGFIERLPEGYATMVGERGARLSGGERQRLAIARALLGDPPVLVLDEPTSMLDAFSEQELRAAMESAREGRTVVVIAHRLATIRSADLIVVLDQGRVVEHGTHATLAAADGLYARLIRSQSEGLLAGT